MQSSCKMKAICFDLDDTLYKEIDYLKSGYRAVSKYVEIQSGVNANTVFKALIDWYYSGQNPFQSLIETFQTKCSLDDCIGIYRHHFPDIHLTEDIRYTLDSLKSKGCLLGIVSDGRKTTQMNKIKALKLTNWMSEELIVINDSPGVFKPASTGYEKFVSRAKSIAYGQLLEFTYVGDNTAKDFLYPNQQGWDTVCLLDDGRNIHKQDFSAIGKEAMPNRIVSNLIDMI